MIIKRFRNRTLTSETYWWAKNSPDEFELFCIHNVPLTKVCAECEEEIDRA